jgi:hypothetical protein
VQQNLVHGSDSPESAARELAIWFCLRDRCPSGEERSEMTSRLRDVEPQLRERPHTSRTP